MRSLAKGLTHIKQPLIQSIVIITNININNSCARELSSTS